MITQILDADVSVALGSRDGAYERINSTHSKILKQQKWQQQHLSRLLQRLGRVRILRSMTK